MYNILADNNEFYVSEYTLNKYPQFLITQVINNTTKNNKIVVEDRTIYIDIDGDSMKCIIDYIRNYPINFNKIDDSLLHKIYHDATYMGLYELADYIQVNLPAMKSNDTVLNNMDLLDTLKNIITTTNILDNKQAQKKPKCINKYVNIKKN